MKAAQDRGDVYIERNEARRQVPAGLCCSGGSGKKVDSSVPPLSVRAGLYFLSPHEPVVAQEQVGTALYILV